MVICLCKDMKVLKKESIEGKHQIKIIGWLDYTTQSAQSQKKD